MDRQGDNLPEAQIRRLVEDRVKAVRAKDVDTAMAILAADVLSFDVVNPLRRIGSADANTRAREWFAAFDGPIGFEMRDLRVSAGEDVAFCHSLNRYSGARKDGTTIDMWVRATTCFRKIDGTWAITHEHQSVPFDPQSGRASLDLTPETP